MDADVPDAGFLEEIERACLAVGEGIAGGSEHHFFGRIRRLVQVALVGYLAVVRHDIRMQSLVESLNPLVHDHPVFVYVFKEVIIFTTVAQGHY